MEKEVDEGGMCVWMCMDERMEVWIYGPEWMFVYLFVCLFACMNICCWRR